MLTAEWPLAAKSDDERMLAAQAIEEKINAADLSGSKEAQKLSPEEEELAEEASRMASERYDQSAPQPDQVQFVFVARLSDEDRRKGMADAFVRAKTNAAELAAAAGVKLGPLVALSGHSGGQSGVGENEYGGYDGSQGPFANFRRFLAEQGGDDADAKPDEAMSAEPATIRFTCLVSASFGLGK